MKRFAISAWCGSGKDGTGTITTESIVLDKAKYNFNSRFKESQGTNPEELIAAAHASCFTMKLSFVLGESGFVPSKIETKAVINFENGITITESHLVIKAQVPGISVDIFEACVKEAELNCPVCKVLNARIIVENKLEK